MTQPWPERTLDQIADQCLGKMLDKTKNRGEPRPYLRNINVRWFGFDLSDVKEMRFEANEAARYSVQRGDLIICEGGYPGRAAIWDSAEPFYIQKALHRVRFHEPERAKWFLYYLYFRDLNGTLRQHFSGAGIQHLTGEALRRLRVPLPPLSEQKRIVAILDETFAGIDAAIANTEKNIENNQDLVTSSLSLVLAHEADGRNVMLEDAVAADCTLSYGIVQPGDEVSNGLPIVRPTDLGAQIIGLDGLKRIDPAKAAGYSRTTLKGGDLLLCVRGTTGVVSQAAKELKGANVTRGIVPIRFKPSVLNQELGYFILRSAEVQKAVREKTYGAALMQINIRDIRKVMLRIPRLDRQGCVLKKMQEIMSNGEYLAEVYERKCAALAALKQSILHRAFAGELSSGLDRLVEAAVA